MELTDIRELHREKDVYIGKEITVGGWVRNNRDSKNFGFLVINDGTFFEPLQVVYGDGLANFQEICKINVGAAVVIRGTIVATPEAKQAFEMQAAEVIVEGPSTADYPLQKKRHSFEYLRTISHLRARTNTFQAVFRVRSLIAYAIHTFFMERGFVYVHTPLITSSDCEGAGEMFQVTTLDMNNVPKTEDGKVDYTQDFFGKKLNPKASMLAARGTVIGIAIVGIFLAWNPDSSVFQIVSFAWAGFGSAFGPVVLFALFWKRTNKQGAIAGMVAGGAMVFIWKYLVAPMGGAWAIYELLPAFLVACLVIVVVSLLTPPPSQEIVEEFEAVGK